MRSCAKINLFLKILGQKGSYHELASRFWRVESLFDEMEWIESSSGSFEIRSTLSCPVEQNSIYKAKEALLPRLKESERREIEKRGISLQKRIPEGAGLGGGSSNAATFLLMAKESLGLSLSLEELAEVGERVGADVPFFVFGYPSANVRGIGEIVEPFEENLVEVELFMSGIIANTARVYEAFRTSFLPKLDLRWQRQEAERWLESSGETILQSQDPLSLNDLYAPALLLYPELGEHAHTGRFFSGSGSTFFAPAGANRG